MKYSIGSTQKPVKPFDFAAATEALTDTYLRLGDAYEQVVAAEGRIAELEATMDNCKSAVQSIEKFGVTATTMAVFNGSNELDKALGLESLDLEAIESLGASVKKIRKQNYIAGLEGVIGDAWDKLVKFLSDLWEKIKRWFKELFDRNAKYVRLVQEGLDKFKKLNGDTNTKVISGLKEPDANAALDAANQLIDCVNKNAAAVKAAQDPAKCLWQLPDKGILEKVGITFDQDGKLNTEGMGEKLQKGKDEIGKLGWTSTTKIPAGFAAVTTGQAVKSAFGAIDGAFKGAIDAAKAAKNDDAKKELAGAKKNMVSHISSYISVYNKLIGLVGNTLVTIINAVK